MTQQLPTLMGAVLEDVATYLGDRVERVLLQPGDEVAWDDCCNGQLAVRLISLVPIPSGTPGARPCPPAGWNATLGISMIRCVATLQDDGEPPTAEAITVDALDVLGDMALIQLAIDCVTRARPEVQRLELLSWTPLGPAGGCAGGEWRLHMFVPSCACP